MTGTDGDFITKIDTDRGSLISITAAVTRDTIRLLLLLFVLYFQL